MRPAEVSAEEITNLALRFLWRTTGDMAAIASVEQCPCGWRAAVVLMPGRVPLGELYFDRHGTLQAELSTPPEELIETATAA